MVLKKNICVGGVFAVLVCTSWLCQWCFCRVSLHVYIVIQGRLMVHDMPVLAERMQVFPGLQHPTKFYIPSSSMLVPAAKHKQHDLSLSF